VASVAHLRPVHLGLDVHKDTISVGILNPDRQVPEVERIANDEASVRRLVARFPDRRRLRACYEAGPTGYELARLLHSMGVGCQVIAPSLIPKAPGERVKTDTRGIAAGWRGCTAPASWWRSASRPRKRKPCGTCAAPAATWSRT
jgi:transposase